MMESEEHLEPLTKEENSARACREGKLERNLSFSKVLSTKPFLAVMAGNFAYNWASFVLMAWLPSYMSEELGFTGQTLMRMQAAPWQAADM